MYKELIHTRDQFFITAERMEKVVDELLSHPWLDSHHKRVLQEWRMFLEFTSAKLEILAEQSEVFDDAQYPIKYHQDCKIREAGEAVKAKARNTNLAIYNLTLQSLPQAERQSFINAVIGSVCGIVPVREFSQIVTAQIPEERKTA